MLLAFVAVLTTEAQNHNSRLPFGKGKFYVATCVSGIDLSYSKSQEWNLDLMAKGGYFFTDNWMFTGQAGFNYRSEIPNTFDLGAGLRYYIEQNGLYIGAGADYVHSNSSYDDITPTVQLGYAFFLNGSVTIEPELYYNHSLKNTDYSGLGLRIGIGIYL